MRALIFLIISWMLLALLVKKIEIHEAYIAMLGAWIGMITIKLKEVK